MAPNIGLIPSFVVLFAFAGLWSVSQLKTYHLPTGWYWFLAVGVALVVSQIYAVRALDTLQRSLALAALWAMVPFVGMALKEDRYLLYFTNVCILLLLSLDVYIFLFGNELFLPGATGRIGPLDLSLNDLGFSLATTSASVWALIVSGQISRFKRILLLALVTLSLLVELLYLGSRAALIGLLVAPISALALTSVGRQWGGLFARLIVIIGAFLLLVWYLYSNALLPQSVHRRLELLLDPAADGSAMLRVSFTKKAWLMFQDYPLTGGGFGNFRFYEYGQSAPVVDQYGHIRYVGSDTHNTHSLYLQILGETGLFGIFAFGGLFIFYLISFVRIMRAGMPVPLARLIVLAWVPVFFGYSFFHDTINYYTLSLFAMGYGAIYNMSVSSAAPELASQQEKKKSSYLPRPVGSVSAGRWKR
ncbi:MAG: O-antigen ligase family protein [Chloroflexota bacterium]